MKKNHVCCQCGNHFRHFRHLFDHMESTGHRLDMMKIRARRIAQVGRRIGISDPALKTRPGVMSWFRRMGIGRTKKAVIG